MLKKQLNIEISWLTFLLTVALAFIFYYGAFVGFIFSDDFSYANKAYLLLQQHLNPANDIMEHRFGMLIPVASFYYLFGINDFSSTLLPFISLLGILTIVLFYFRSSPAIAAIAILLIGTNYYMLYFSNKLFPDVPLSLCVLVTLLCLAERNNQRTWLTSIGFVFFFFYGFLIKETIIYLIPFYLYLLVQDWVHKINISFWVKAVSILIILFTIYFTSYYLTKGNAFYRFEVIMDGHYISGGSYYDKSLQMLFNRLSYEPILMLISSELIIPIALGLPLVFQWKDLTLDEKFWLKAAIFFLAFLWIGSTSLRVYNPIVLNPRMFIPLVPVWSIVAAYSMQRIVKSVNLISMLTLIFLIITLFSYYYFNNLKLASVYGIIVLYLFFLLVLIVKEKFRSIMLIGLFFALLLHPLYIIWKNPGSNYEVQKDIFQKFFILNDKNKLLLTDPITGYGYKYFYQFKELSNLKVYSYLELDKFMKESKGEKFVLLNQINLDELIAAGDPVPSEMRKPPVSWSLVMSKSDVSLYKVSK